MAQGPSDTILVAIRITLRIRESKVRNPDPPDRRRFVFSEHSFLVAIVMDVNVSFGMQHDTSENDCESRPGELQHIMSPQMTAEASPLIWSQCSRNAITVFLESVLLADFYTPINANATRCISNNESSPK